MEAKHGVSGGRARPKSSINHGLFSHLRARFRHNDTRNWQWWLMIAKTQWADELVQKQTPPPQVCSSWSGYPSIAGNMPARSLHYSTTLSYQGEDANEGEGEQARVLVGAWNRETGEDESVAFHSIKHQLYLRKTWGELGYEPGASFLPWQAMSPQRLVTGEEKVRQVRQMK